MSIALIAVDSGSSSSADTDSCSDDSSISPSDSELAEEEQSIG